MSYVVMNIVEVPSERAGEFEHRFATRAGKIKNSAGFEAFELLKPADGKNAYIVYTRWESKEAFETWVASPDFAAGHRQHSDQGPVGTSSQMWTFDLLEGEYSA